MSVDEDPIEMLDFFVPPTNMGRSTQLCIDVFSSMTVFKYQLWPVASHIFSLIRYFSRMRDASSPLCFLSSYITSAPTSAGLIYRLLMLTQLVHT